ncbi:conserved hypothetical protein [Thiobacillus denitrificans ATCC 25259]|uniref:Peptidase S8/S53 domain-containing protein n=1 Tax=Thiobacillus denitrificans (strain ATCC 25259 / T1) TaxID=292415 RepID=Q3SI82_THIDA|nr:S8 family peptidase [Thiobacillus denitrificans]AAZ97646.1 conserved hypothetical protein [Thiobacillus denitrificans ATCC 25259]
MAERLPHLIFNSTAITKQYQRPSRKIDIEFPLKERDRQQHGAQLLEALRQAKTQEPGIISGQQTLGRDAEFTGVYLTFESDPGFELAFESLGFAPSRIELLVVKQEGERMLATVFVPEGKIGYFIRRVEAYLNEGKDKPNKKGELRPQYKKLVESIASIRLAALEALWTDSPDLFPRDETPIWWEVWLRIGDGFDEVGFFRTHAAQLNLEVADDEVRFLERCVVLVRGSRSQLARSLQLLGGMAELRKAKQNAEHYTTMNAVQQHAAVAVAAQYLQTPGPDAPAVCILDTGVSQDHPLLAPFLDAHDKHACHPDWGTHDHDRLGHGTAMAGLALHGDLSETLAQQPFPSPSHRLESVKVLPPTGDNPPHLYGYRYSQAMDRVTITAPHRRRTFCSAVTTTDSRDRGRPSSWSAQLDKLASGMEDGTQRLIFQTAGNAEHSNITDYPASNALDGIHDPAQSWNVLTVGAYTGKWQIDEATYPGRQPIAPAGALAPTSCTAVSWPTSGRQKWPNKPDVVLEGGNWALDPAFNFAEDLDSLQLLSTGHEPHTRPLVTFGETSAATALAARMAAVLQSHYPDLWPETLRALLVHSSQWTSAMRAAVGNLQVKGNVRQLLRTCGFGVPQLDDALWSAKHALTLIVQDEMQPFTTGENSTIRARDIHYHALPWPAEALRALPLGTQVEMRVTLSYFIQPNPGQRGWSGKFSYASHGLRFRVKAPGESHEAFEQRINQAARDEEYERTGVSDSDFWVVGSDTRELGSLHSDLWQGTSEQLADCGYLAIYPVTGWWRTRKALNRWHSRARYALVVSIRTPEELVDIYTPVAAEIGIAV